MNKKLDITSIQSDLEGSAFFSKKRPADIEASHTDPGRAGGPGLQARPEHRIIRPRHKFDIYEDQYESLQKIAESQRQPNGQLGSMSAMVREAIDIYLKARKTS